MRTNMDTESSMRRDISNLLQLRKTIAVFRARRYASTHYICVHLNFKVFVKRIEAVKNGTEEGTRRGMRKPLCVTLYILKEDCIGTIFRNYFLCGTYYNFRNILWQSFHQWPPILVLLSSLVLNCVVIDITFTISLGAKPS